MCPCRKSIKLLARKMNISNLSASTLPFSKVAPMASKSTPKKVYKNTSTENISRCRLCNGVQDPRHCKNLFNKKNQVILKNVASILGEDLPHVDGFPSLICRPCERRVSNTISFKNLISETQKSLSKDSRSKRCVEISPSVLRPSVKAAAVESRRRSLTFDAATSLLPTEQMSWPLPKNVSQLTLNLINNSFLLNLLNKAFVATSVLCNFDMLFLSKVGLNYLYG